MRSSLRGRLTAPILVLTLALTLMAVTPGPALTAQDMSVAATGVDTGPLPAVPFCLEDSHCDRYCPNGGTCIPPILCICN